MVSNSVTESEARNSLGHLLDRVEAGQDIVITRQGVPVAKLVPVFKKDAGAIDAALDTFKEIRHTLAAKGDNVTSGEVHQWTGLSHLSQERFD